MRLVGVQVVGRAISTINHGKAGLLSMMTMLIQELEVQNLHITQRNSIVNLVSRMARLYQIRI